VQEGKGFGGELSTNENARKAAGVGIFDLPVGQSLVQARDHIFGQIVQHLADGVIRQGAQGLCGFFRP